MSDDGFFSRWSRKKQESKRELAAEADPAESIAGLNDGEYLPEKAAASGGEGTENNELSPEELALLPRVEDLTSESDISGFLRTGVPNALRNAALRRMWVLDPSVRDYVGDARDYAYDWSVPGGVPGTGPLLPTDDPTALIDRLFSSVDSKAGQRANLVADQDDAPSDPAPLTARDVEANSAREERDRSEARSADPGSGDQPDHLRSTGRTILNRT